jgi:hypothetical protein
LARDDSGGPIHPAPTRTARGLHKAQQSRSRTSSSSLPLLASCVCACPSPTPPSSTRATSGNRACRLGAPPALPHVNPPGATQPRDITRVRGGRGALAGRRSWRRRAAVVRGDGDARARRWFDGGRGRWRSRARRPRTSCSSSLSPSSARASCSTASSTRSGLPSRSPTRFAPGSARSLCCSISPRPMLFVAVPARGGTRRCLVSLRD